MLFEWDEDKDKINKQKHEMPLRAGISVFDDLNAIEFDDDRFNYGEEHSKEKPIDNSDIDFEKADALTDEEIEERAKNDPDSLPFSEEQLKKIIIRRRGKENG